MDIKEIFT